MKTLLFGLSLSALAQDAPEEVPAAEARNKNIAKAKTFFAQFLPCANTYVT